MGIQSKLFVAFLSCSLFVVASMYAFMQWSGDQGLLIFINKRDVAKQEKIAEVLARYYAQHKSWKLLENNHQLWQQINRSVTDAVDRQERFGPPRGSMKFMAPPPPPPRSRVILLNEQRQALFGRLKEDDKYSYTPVMHQGKAVGWLTTPAHKEITDDFNLSFVEAQNQHFLLVCGVLILLSACVSLPLSARLVKPVKSLAKASHQLASGDFSIRIKAKRRDELGLLIDDFNRLAATLESNEGARKRWVGDLAHELRTPLTIIRGEMEAMLDGVRPLSQGSVTSAHQEVLHLQRLVEDLYELTNADVGALTYRKESLNLVDLVDFTEMQFRDACQQKQIKLTRIEPGSGGRLEGEGVYIYADKNRLIQLLQNLLQNSLKYTEPKGEISLMVTLKGDQALLVVEDSLPGVETEELNILFDYLYRADESRNRLSGGAGLGLAICQRIVEGHDGVIQAEHSELGGLKISVLLPLSR